MKKVIRLVLLSFVVVVVALAGCTAQQEKTYTSVPDVQTLSSVGDVKEFNAVISGYSYDPLSVTVNLGDTVRINIKNNDAVTHGISLPVFGVQEFVRPGQTKTIQFVANQRGAPETFCSTDHGEKLLINVV